MRDNSAQKLEKWQWLLSSQYNLIDKVTVTAFKIQNGTEQKC